MIDHGATTWRVDFASIPLSLFHETIRGGDGADVEDDVPRRRYSHRTRGEDRSGYGRLDILHEARLERWPSFYTIVKNATVPILESTLGGEYFRGMVTVERNPTFHCVC